MRRRDIETLLKYDLLYCSLEERPTHEAQYLAAQEGFITALEWLKVPVPCTISLQEANQAFLQTVLEFYMETEQYDMVKGMLSEHSVRNFEQAFNRIYKTESKKRPDSLWGVRVSLLEEMMAFSSSQPQICQDAMIRAWHCFVQQYLSHRQFSLEVERKFVDSIAPFLWYHVREKHEGSGTQCVTK